MKVKTSEWLAHTGEERFWILENTAFRQWKRKNRKGESK